MTLVTRFQTGYKVDAAQLQPGDIFRKEDDSLWEVTPEGDQAALGSGGGSSAVIEYTFAFAFDTAGLTDGVVAYTPSVGQTLVDVWFEVGTVWDGTTPAADIGTFVGGDAGLFSLFGNSTVDMTLGDVVASENAGLQVSAMGDNDLLQNVLTSWFLQPAAAVRTVPLKFTAPNPVKVVVSQDGTKGGADPGSSAGAAILHLLISTPVVSPG